MPLGYLGATRERGLDKLSAELYDELTCHRRRWGRRVQLIIAIRHGGFASYPSTLSVRIHVCSGDSLKGPEKVSASPDLPTPNLPCINERVRHAGTHAERCEQFRYT